jgi:hypothetical protein
MLLENTAGTLGWAPATHIQYVTTEFKPFKTSDVGSNGH